MKTNSDSGDYTYPSVRFVPAVPDSLPPLTGPEKLQIQIDELEKRILHLEKIVHLMLNPEGE